VNPISWDQSWDTDFQEMAYDSIGPFPERPSEMIKPLQQIYISESPDIAAPLFRGAVLAGFSSIGLFFVGIKPSFG
jgi:hypothetical protein